MDKITTSEAPVLHFIRDEPAKQDLFGSHDRLARAIAGVISTQHDLKVVGLLGAWGSGKSTVVELAQDHLERDDGGTKTFCFKYDAWLHQSDPPRRAFLETLIAFLIDKKLTLDSAKWQAKLDHLNRQIEDTEATTTPTLTTTGRLALLFLLLLPLGMQFVGHDWVIDAFGPSPKPYVHSAVVVGISILFAPIIFAMLIYLYWRPTIWPFAWRWPPFSRAFFSKANWTTHRHPHEEDSIVSLVMNKEVQRVRNRITRSPDPTAIEFQSTFREIMDDVSKEGRRFLFIIDNLDRLPETEAVAMWGTIRSFFLGDAGAARATRGHLPTVILPIDPHAVERMYSVTHADLAPALAESFSDKTFDLTFRVTPPVLSDWKAYLATQMRTVFGSHIDEDSIYLTGLLLENSLPPLQGAPITPRGINKLINLIGTLWLQWRTEDVTFVSIAYYAIFLRDAVDIQVAVGTPQAGIANYDPNWQRSVAAIHFGVPPEHAVQVLIEQPLRAAINAKDHEEFSRLAKIVGFEQVLQKVVDQATIGEGADPSFVLKASALLNDLNATDQTWATAVWRSLRRGFSKPTAWQALSPDEAPSLAALLKHSNEPETALILNSVANKLATMHEEGTKAPAFAGEVAQICAVAADAASKLKLALPDILVPGTAGLFLNILAACSTNELVRSALKSKASPDEIVGELANILGDQKLISQFDQKLRVVMSRGMDMPWNKLIDLAGQIVQDNNANHFAMNFALLSLGLLRLSQKAARNRIKTLFDGQFLTSRFHEAHAQKRLVIEAKTVALLMLSGPFQTPNGQAWAELLKDRPELVGMIDTELLDFDTEDNLEEFVKLATDTPDTLALCRSIISLRVREERIGALFIDKAVTQLPQYLKCIDKDLHDEFIRQIVTYDTFWDVVVPLPLDSNLTRILQVLVSEEGGDRRKAQEVLTEKLKALSAEQWAPVITSGAVPFAAVKALGVNPDDSEHLGTPLYDALKSAIPQLLTSKDAPMRERWFELLKLTNSSARITLLKYARDQIVHGGAVVSLAALLRAGGSTFLEDADFASVADAAVRYVTLPLLNDADGFAWLMENSTSLSVWVARCEPATRDVLVERLSELWTAADEAGRARYQELEVAWSLPELPIRAAPKDDGAQTA